MRVTTEGMKIKKPAWRAIVRNGARARSLDKRCGYFLHQNTYRLLSGGGGVDWLINA